MGISATLLGQSRWDFLPQSNRDITPMRIGIIGCGPRAWYNAIPKLVEYDEYELTCLCDIRENLVSRTAAAAADEYKINLATYTDYQQMLRDEKLDAVVVLIDADKQVPVVCDALEVGLHVMAEVPLCYSIEDCWRIVATVERTGKQFLLMEQIRYAGYVQAWRNIVASGVLGPIVLAEGEYFHDLPLRMYQNAEGVYHTRDQIDAVSDIEPTWRAKHPPIVYLPHDLSPVLHILDDRVERVTGMESPSQDGSGYPAMQMALMQTQKSAVLRMGVSFSTAAPERHWQHLKGTQGFIEAPRHGVYSSESPYLMWVDGWQLPKPIEMPWGLPRTDAPPAAVGSGHGDCDYYVFAAFADAVLRDVPVAFDVYQAVEITAPAIHAGESIKRGGEPIDVPQFRPGADRKVGELPAFDKNLLHA